LQKPCKTCNVMFCAEIEHRGVHVQIKVFLSMSNLINKDQSSWYK
jgi:hypothetical protein